MTDKVAIERLISLQDVLLDNMSMQARKAFRARGNRFTSKLFHDALVSNPYSFSDALTAVYSSGLWHGVKLGPKVLEDD